MRYVSIILLVGFFVFLQANVQEDPLLNKDMQKAASDALSTFKELVNEQNYKLMGFETPSEVRDTILGEPFRIFMVRLDHLKKYEPGSEPSRLLNSEASVIYPVIVNKQVRSSVKVQKMKDRWEATSYGSPNLIRMLTKVRKEVTKTEGFSASSCFVVRVPALNFYFIAHKTEKVLMITPLLDDPRFEFKEGMTIPADKAFEALLPAAKKHDGLPR